ncbi:mitochondrial matrix iron-sulfur protein [Tilletia horrida]|nr:mitochondrial matrix iron-sulfur protein [Tilletia horrida]
MSLARTGKSASSLELKDGNWSGNELAAQERRCQAPYLDTSSVSVPTGRLKVTFRDAAGKDIKTVEANEGDDLLTLAHAYGIDLEGACEGSVACSTCHVILESDVYDLLEEPSDDENDMLDLAFGLTDTSRLGCQVKVTKETDGLLAQLPAATRNMYVDGHKPKPH